jgi:hypothetical protein
MFFADGVQQRQLSDLFADAPPDSRANRIVLGFRFAILDL